MENILLAYIAGFFMGFALGGLVEEFMRKRLEKAEREK